MSSTREAGYFILESMKIKSLSSGAEVADITNLIKDFVIRESMSTTYLDGATKVLDTTNLLERLTGEETIEIVYTDFFDSRITEEYYIYALTGIQPYSDQQDIGVTFDLSFCSLDKLISDSISVRKSYNNMKTIEMVENLYNEYFTPTGVTKPLEILGDTEGANSLVIPNYRPGEAMDFLARKAYSVTDKSSYFRFWETREKYYFATLEGMVDAAVNSGQTLAFYYTDFQSNAEQAQLESMNRIRKLSLGDRFNTFEERNYGAYRHHVTELDYMNRTAIEHQYNHLDEYPEYRLPSPNIQHIRSQEFINKYLAEGPDQIVVKDYPSVGATEASLLRPNQYYAETYTRKTANAYHHHARKINIEINGRSRGIYPGALIELDIPKFKFPVDTQLSSQYAGLYLIESVSHNFSGKYFTQSLTLSKSGFDGGDFNSSPTVTT